MEPEYDPIGSIGIRTAQKDVHDRFKGFIQVNLIDIPDRAGNKHDILSQFVTYAVEPAGSAVDLELSRRCTGKQDQEQEAEMQCFQAAEVPPYVDAVQFIDPIQSK